MTYWYRLKKALASCAAVILLLTSAALPATAAAPPTTPEGITLVEVMRDLPTSQPQVLWIRPGDSDGRTVLVADRDAPGTSCVESCESEFSPVLAPQYAKAAGDWSLIRRRDGSQQWAYQSRGLYTWSKEQVPGELATNVALTETANQKFAENAVKAGNLLPPSGWNVARLAPTASLALPDGLDAQVVSSLEAVALTDASGRTLYAFNGDARQDGQACTASQCERRWIPLAAPALAQRVGEFTPSYRADGSVQWAYKRLPLYTYSGDLLPGDAHGVGVDKQWTAAVIFENYKPSGVGVRTLSGYGDVLTLNGITLYGGYLFEKRWGGRNLRSTFTNDYWKGKALGAAACVSVECLKTWHPFRATADAKPHGFWEPLQRPDGTLQWAYKGYALYTYVGDQTPGDHNGQATYAFEPVAGHNFDYERVTFLQHISGAGAGVGIYWNIAKP